MIKDSTYIRNISPAQKKLLIKVQEKTKIKAVSKILFFALEKYVDQESEIERLKRIIEYKQRRIEQIQSV